jgi:hypothetical protein
MTTEKTKTSYKQNGRSVPKTEAGNENDDIMVNGLQEAQHEHGQERREGNQKGKSDKRITESKARHKEALHCAQTQHIKLGKVIDNAQNATREGDKRRLARRSWKRSNNKANIVSFY